MAVAAMVVIDPLITAPSSNDEVPLGDQDVIADMLRQVDEAEIYDAVYALQNFTSRHYGQPGNVEASDYIYSQLSGIAGLSVEYQSGELRNVIATLPGLDAVSSTVYMVGAHYDSVNEAGGSDSLGATDNGGGVAIVLELARIMSQYRFNHTVMFSFWNAEDGGADTKGSEAYAQHAADSGMDIALYMNFDSSCYDPDGRLVLDIMTNPQSRWVSSMMAQHNSLYEIGFTLTYNVHDCWSDHRSFWDHGFDAVMTHQEEHGYAHSADDTVDKVSTLYAKKNGQLGMSVLARLAELG
jgi:Zn-dependent M28 family amino/carboxypeptidase